MLLFHHGLQFHFVLFEQVPGLFLQGEGFFILQELFGRLLTEPLPGECAASFMRLDLSLEQADTLAVPLSQDTASKDDLLANEIQP